MTSPITDSGAHGDAAAAAAAADRRTRMNIGLHVAFVAVLCGLAAGYAGSYVSLVQIWANSGTFEFAFLIFPICAVLVWSQRRALARVQGMPRPTILVLAVGLVLFWLAGALADINLAQHIAIVALLPVLVYAVYGPRVAAVIAFPMGYVFFAIPFGNFMVGPLQDITAQLSVWLMHFTDVPVYKSGRYIHTPAAIWHVAEACSGVKFFFATTAFGVLYAYLFFTRMTRRLAFIACAMLVPIMANALRVFFTILIGEHFGVEYASGTDHAIFGWQFFGTVLVLLFFAGWPFHEPPKKLPSEADTRPPVAVPGRAIVSTALLCLCVLLSGPVWFNVSQAMVAAHSQTPNVALPATLDGRAQGAVASAPDPGMRFTGPDARLTQVYAAAGGDARVDRVAYSGRAGENRELITETNRLFDPNRWIVVARQPVTAADGVPAYIRLTLASKTTSARLDLSYVMRVGDRWQTSQIRIKLWQLLYGLIGRAAPTELIAITQSAAGKSDAAADEAAFAQAVLGYAARDAARTWR